MKTKRAITSWWCDLGLIINGRNDYKDFYNKIDPCINVEIKEYPNANTPQKILKLTKSTWKHPLYLWFFNTGECVKMEGF